MKIFVLSISMLVAMLTQSITAQTFNDETVHYKVMYKWGLINKQAGTASLSIKTVGENYNTQLIAKSEPWADKFYTVRDTLNGQIQKDGFLPLFYEKIAHEGGDFKHDIVNYSRNADTVIGYCTRIKRKGDKAKGTKKEHVISATGRTVDMLSVYYYMRSLDYPNMKNDEELTLNIFSGKSKEILTIKFHGIETITCDQESHPCYHISFTFTSDGEKKTSEDMDAWISTDSRRIPLKLEGTLPVGKVQCFYTGG